VIDKVNSFFLIRERIDAKTVNLIIFTQSLQTPLFTYKQLTALSIKLY